MARSLPNFGVALLFLGLLLTTGCNNTQAEFSVVGPAPLVATANIHSSFGVEPSTVQAEMLDTDSCVIGHSFGARIGIRAHGDDDVILRSLRFKFVDHRGVPSYPSVISIPTLATPFQLMGSMPTGPTIPVPALAPLPTATVIPIPGGAPINGVLIGRGRPHSFPYFVKFGCGVFNDGVIVIIIDAGDRHGRFSTSELRVAVRRS
jgi:hypothetical protein